MNKVFSKKFFNRNSVVVAKDLLGKYLVRKIGRKIIAAQITEVEAYGGPVRDLASHASRGKTARNYVMFGPSGRWYVYFTYGMHWMLNVVTKFDRYPSAVLIRGVVVPPFDPASTRSPRFAGEAGLGEAGGLRVNLARTIQKNRGRDRHHLAGEQSRTTTLLDGPAKLTKFFKIDKNFNDKPATQKTGLWIGAGSSLRGASATKQSHERFKIKSSPRIGVAYAGPIWSKKKLRFFI